MNIPCPAIQRYETAILAEVAELKEARGRMAENANQRIGLQAKLESVSGERQKNEARRTELEGASAVALHRMNLTPEKAIKEIEQLQRKIETAGAEEAELSEQIRQLGGATEEDSSRLQSSIKPLIYRCETASNAALLALLNAILDTDVAHHEKSNWNLFRQTFVAGIYHERKRRLQYELWAVIDEVLAEPILPLEQRPMVLPNAQASAVCREVHAT